MTKGDPWDQLSESYLSDPEITQSKMFGGVALKVRGKVFACSYKGKLVLKLPVGTVDALIASGGAERFDSGTGRPATEWVALGRDQSDSWAELAARARVFVGG